MPEISGNALMMAIQAVDDKINRLKTMIDASDPDEPDLADMEEAMLAYCNTADELRVGYEAALRLSSNLPAYERLVRP